ncbi:MAG: transposase [Planctomycetota bacterium]|nr:transposase [Planctomycetota bacterium]
MARHARVAPGGLVYHVLNRSVARLPLFEKEGDYLAFEKVLEEAGKRHPMRILAYCVMPNHWHLVLWPRKDGELTAFVRWLTHTHTMRWHAHHETAGTGHLYQGRFKSVPVQTDEHLLVVCRYVERNALRAKLVERAERWRWGSLWRRTKGDEEARGLLHKWPVEEPGDWVQWVSGAQRAAEVEEVREAVVRGRPYGSERWRGMTVERLGLEWTVRPRGRPRKTGAHEVAGEEP